MRGRASRTAQHARVARAHLLVAGGKVEQDSPARGQENIQAVERLALLLNARRKLWNVRGEAD